MKRGGTNKLLNGLFRESYIFQNSKRAENIHLLHQRNLKTQIGNFEVAYFYEFATYSNETSESFSIRHDKLSDVLHFWLGWKNQKSVTSVKNLKYRKNAPKENVNQVNWISFCSLFDPAMWLTLCGQQ